MALIYKHDLSFLSKRALPCSFNLLQCSQEFFFLGKTKVLLFILCYYIYYNYYMLLYYSFTYSYYILLVYVI